MVTQDEFIKRALNVHGDKYDYSKAKYQGSTVKMCIICPQHGEFWQEPHTHLRGSGCPECGRASTRNQKEVTCDYCGKVFMRRVIYDKRNNKHVFCCKGCESEFRKLNNSTVQWQGGHIGKSTGYKYIRVNGKDVGEHILVMTRHLGRRLKRNEVVHHIDGNKLNNSLENLQLMTRQEHSRLHSSLRRTNASCLRCGKERTIHARGLCNNCYRYCLKHNQLSRYEYTRKRQEK